MKPSSYLGRRRAAVLRRAMGIASAAVALILVAAIADAHDLFLRPSDFIVRPNASVHVRVLNGTFTTSEAPVARSRLYDLSVAGPEGIAHPDTTGWTLSTGAGTSPAAESAWHVELGRSGTYLLGASVRPSTIALTGAQFNEYLQEDGLPDVLAARRKAGELGEPARERYSKHVKALVRAESSRTRGADAGADTAYRSVLGYVAELIPLEDPYSLHPGGVLHVRALVDGAPVSNQVVLAGGRTSAGVPIPERAVRTGADGVAAIALRGSGTWYVKFIQMSAVPASARDSVNYESKWATLTFALR